MSLAAGTGVRPVRGRVVMLVDNTVKGDSRVQKAAKSMAAAGWEVILLGRSPDGLRQTWQIGQAEVRLLPMPSPLSKRPFEFRRSWLRGPLAYAPTGVAAYRTQRVKAWQADLRVRRAAITVGAVPARGRRRFLVRRVGLRCGFLAARFMRVWVEFRSRQLTRAHASRRKLAGPWDRAYAWFWQTVQGDRSWRRLEPRLWDYEMAFGNEVDQLSPDLIHANDFYMLGVGARATLRARAAGRRVKLVWDAHEFLPGLKPRADNARWLPAHCAHEREYAPCADAVVTVSPELAGLLQTQHGLAVTPAVVLNAPEVSGAAADPSVPHLRELCGLGPKARLLVYSGAAAVQRGLDIMVEALPHLDGVHVAFVVAHPPSRYVLSLVSKAEGLGVGERLHVLPYVPHDQVVEFLSSADAGVIPIHHWPNHEIALITKFFEYAHARLPMIVSDVRTMAETTRAVGLGEVFRAEDVDDFVRVVKIVMSDTEKYRAAYDRPGLLENWTWEAQAKILDDIYGNLLPDLRTNPEVSLRITAPDVSVIMAVRDAMPYLTKCIRSLIEQSIGMARFEVIAVDCGSTDGGAEHLTRFAQLHPHTFKVIRQPTSALAAAYYRGLRQAKGRYILLMGAEDHLGVEALARLVATADEHVCEVVLPNMVAGKGRYQTTDVFPATEIDLDLADPRLCAALANARFIRRDIIDTNLLRYLEDTPVGGLTFAGDPGAWRSFTGLPFAELPFALAACSRAQRISVLTDYDHYHHARRPDGDRPDSVASAEERIRRVDDVMALTARLVPPGPRRDAVNRHLFNMELGSLLQSNLADLDRAQQERICADVGLLVDLHLTEEIAERLDASTRVRLWLARHGLVDALLAVIRQDAEPGQPPIVTEKDRLYLGYDSFRKPDLPLPDDLFRLTESAATVVASRLEINAIGWGPTADDAPTLTVSTTSKLDLTAIGLASVGISVGPVRGAAGHQLGGDAGTIVRGRVAVAELLAQCPPGGVRWEACLQLELPGSNGEVTLRGSAPMHTPLRLGWRGRHPYWMRPYLDADGVLVIHVVPVTIRRVLGKLRRKIRDR
jgi:glycosyltransferase involved in cell wall biosynthesis